MFYQLRSKWKDSEFSTWSKIHESYRSTDIYLKMSMKLYLNQIWQRSSSAFKTWFYFFYWWNVSLQAYLIDRLNWFLKRIGELSNYIINESSSRYFIKNLHRIFNLIKIKQGFYNAQSTIFIEKIYKKTAKESCFEMKSAENDIESIIRVAKNDCDKRDFFSKYTEWVFHQKRKKFESSNFFQLRNNFFEQFMTNAIHELCRR